MTTTHWRQLSVALAAALLAGCATTPPPQAAVAGKPAQAARAAEAEPAADEAASQAPASVPIGQLTVDADKEVRIAGLVDRVLGMRLVPPKVIFQVRDTSGTVKVVVNEKATFTEGQKIELVGRYEAIPSPMHNGPGDAPEEPFFVVDRYIAF